MKKDETPKVNNVKEKGNVKNFGKVQGQKSQSSKPFLGCDTCKLKNNLPLKKTKTTLDDQEKLKKNVENAQNVCKTKIKLTDLCEEDKKRIVELMEELAKFAEKNRSLKESLDFSEKAKKEQHECLMKQTNLHLEEKNMFLKEIQAHKARLAMYENEMREKMNAWEARERSMDREIRHLVKALQKSFNEKSDLMKEIGNLKMCLKQSLESFELLRNEVTSLQHLSGNPVKARPSSRSVVKLEETRNSQGPEESADECLPPAKSDPPNEDSLNIINNKLEKLYALFQGKTEPVLQEVKKEAETEAGVDETKNDAECDGAQNSLERYGSEEDGGGARRIDPCCKFLKPFNEYNKTSIQAERILKKIEKPFLIGYDGRVDRGQEKSEEGPNVEKVTPRNDVLDEDRLLSELFYSDAVVDLGVESALFLTGSQEYPGNEMFSTNTKS